MVQHGESVHKKSTARWRAKKNRSAARVTDKRMGIYISASVFFPVTRANSILHRCRRKHYGQNDVGQKDVGQKDVGQKDVGQKDVGQKDGRYFSAQHFSAPNVLTSSTT